jgi:hypothetical protein
MRARAQEYLRAAAFCESIFVCLLGERENLRSSANTDKDTDKDTDTDTDKDTDKRTQIRRHIKMHVRRGPAVMS